MKQLRKRLIACALTVCMLLSLCVSAAAADHWWDPYVDNPSSSWTLQTDNGVVHTEGEYLAFTSDTHRYTYLVKDLLAAANDIVGGESEGSKVGLIAFGGDFANEKVLYDDNMSILQAALGNTPACFTKGNHEGNVSDADFEARAGMSRIGETAINDSGNYHFFNFGAYDGNQTFQPADIETLGNYLKGLTDNKPVFIVSHYPLHYYNDRRTSKNADQLVDLLNNYPQAIFLWGHNHTESDPNYGMIRVPGDVIQTGAKADTTREIKFTYACLGALRDGTNGANGLLAKVDGTKVQFRYINLHNSVNEEDIWTDAQGNENSVRVAGTPTVSSDVTVETNSDYSKIEIASLFVDRPLVDKTAATEAQEYSPRFHVESIDWSDPDNNPVTTFDFKTAYTVTMTLKAEDGYVFTEDTKAYVNKEYVGPMPGEGGYEAEIKGQTADTLTIAYTFEETVAQGEALAPATAIKDNAVYVLATDAGYAASYLYNPADHGEESRPDYAVQPADVVLRDGKLISEVDPSTWFTAMKDDDGFMLVSPMSELYMEADYYPKDGPLPSTYNYLSMSNRGGDLGIQAAEEPGSGINTNWYLDAEGHPYLNVDGNILYAAYTKNFTLVTDPADCNVRLYEAYPEMHMNLGAYVKVTAPVAGEMPDNTVSEEYATYEVTNVEWDTEEAFGYGQSYTVTVSLKAKTFKDEKDEDIYFPFDPNYVVPRVNGNNAEMITCDGETYSMKYTFPATETRPGNAASVTAKKVDAFEDGKTYVVVSNGKAMTLGLTDGIYAKAADVTVTGDTVTGITTDMLLTATEKDGAFALTRLGKTFTGLSLDGTPDTWGYAKTEGTKSAVTYSLTDGVLAVESTGAEGGPGGPPPGGSKVNAVYYNDGHFNYATFATPAQFEIYELSTSFRDVPDDGSADWYIEHLDWAVMNGVVNGYTATEFRPNAAMTRAGLVTVLWRMNGCPEPTIENPFTDLDENAYYYDAVLWAYENGITKGYTETTFVPDKELTREQFVTFLYRYYGTPEVSGENAFTDVTEGTFSYDAILWASEKGYVQGYEDGTFRGANPCTRAHTITVLGRIVH